MVIQTVEVSHGGLKQMIPTVINNKQDIILTGAPAPALVLTINQPEIKFKQSRLIL